VRFDQYGGIDVLNVVDVERPSPGPGQLLVRVKAAGINPGESKIREGFLHERWPATFPSGQGSDLAGVVEQTGGQTDGFKAGDELIGFTDNRASQAEFVVVDAENVTPRPPNVSWEAAGALFVAGVTAYATVRAVELKPGDTVVIAGASGGVGSIAVQLAKDKGATVIGIASESNHEWLKGHGVIPVTYGERIADRLREAAGGKIDAFIDAFGDYVQLALDLGVKPERIDTIVDFTAGEKYGVKTEGNAAAASSETVAELAALIDQGKLEIPIANVYPLEQVRDAYRSLEQEHPRGKIVLEP